MTKRFDLTRIFAFPALLLCCGALMAGGPLPSTTDTVAVLLFADASDTGGVSHLTRTVDTILIVVEAADLVPGDVHTLWWIVFNDPEACDDWGDPGDGDSEEGCGEDDIFDLIDGGLNIAGVCAAQIAVGNASGNVAKPDGTLEFGGNLTADGHQVLFVPADFDGAPPADCVDGGDVLLTADPKDAEVHVIVQTHGQARGGPQLGRQLSRVDFGCTPACADIQFAVHKP